MRVPNMKPIVKNIHQAVLRAVKKPYALDMRRYHTCETTHCRAGWVVVLAGEDGRRLEEISSTLNAATEIYHASSPIPVSGARFFDTDIEAMADIERCAEEEAKLDRKREFGI